MAFGVHEGGERIDFFAVGRRRQLLHAQGDRFPIQEIQEQPGRLLAAAAVLPADEPPDGHALLLGHNPVWAAFPLWSVAHYVFIGVPGEKGRG